MEVTLVFDSSHCLLPLVKDKMFRKVDLLTSEGKTKTSFLQCASFGPLYRDS